MSEKTPEVTGRHWPLYVIVSLSGASVLAIEILGTRILGPFYGMSIFLWSALITVTLSALSLGYMLGGRMADRKATLTRLGIVLASAGIWLLLVPILRKPALWIANPMGLRAAVITASMILFFPPLAALGMVSPLAIKLRTASLDEVGRSAGNLYSVSTIASVAAALLTGFVLIPKIGIMHLTVAVGIILLLTASFSLFIDRKRGRSSVILSIIFILCAAAGPFADPGSPDVSEEGPLVALEESPYGEIRVIDFLDARFLLIDGAIHTFIDAGTGNNLFPYVNVLDLARIMCGSPPGKALLVGLGGGSVAKSYSEARWHVDAVEIDPVVVSLARKHFGLRDTDADIFIMDGRQFIRSTDNLYDVIILDAFGSGSIPFHLITTEAFELVGSRLSERGIVAINLQTIGWRSTLVRSVAATLSRSFDEVAVLPIVEPPNELGNIILFASNRPIKPSYELPDPLSRYEGDYDRAHAWNNRFVPDMEDVPVLTDELNPIDLWSEQINLAERRGLRKYFEDSGAYR